MAESSLNCSMEIWKDVVGYEGLYLISNTGKVKSLGKNVDIGLGRIQFKPERILKPGLASNGYFTVAICKNRAQTSTCLHTIIAKSFIPNPNNFRCVNHIDGNKTNNAIENLEWCTHKRNSQHAYEIGIRKPFRKVTSDQVIQIRAMKKIGVRNLELAAMYEVTVATINGIVNYKTRING